ncbi:MAG: hypothetical protein ACK8QZ_12815 [Anaerolineales bacterium]
MENEYQLVMSPLCRSVTSEGQTIRFDIYRGPESDWSLEAVDEFNNSTVWDDLFATDQAALDEALRTIREEGIASLIGSPSGAA